MSEKKMLEAGTEFYLVNGGKLEKHIIAGGYKKDDEIFYIFLPQEQVHTIGEAQVYENQPAAELDYRTRLEESGKKNLEIANDIFRDGMEVVDRTKELTEEKK